MATIGIPRTLAYFIYFPFWREFFASLGHNVVVSSPTSKAILDKGVKEAVNDACIPIKLYHGHVAELIGKVDYVFTPRLVSLRKFGEFGTETLCPKFLGLPDMLRASIDDLPPLIDTRVDLRQGRQELFRVCRDIGEMLGAARSDIRRAVAQAKRRQERFQRLLYQGVLPEQAIEAIFGGTLPSVNQGTPEFSVAVVGYPYVVYDPFVNVGLFGLLERENARVYTQEMLPARKMAAEARKLPKNMFWYFSNRALHGALYFMAQKYIDGIIHVTAFACGPDSMVDRMMELQAKQQGGIPFMSIMVDEHTGEAGIRTRVEAFLDMLRYRRQKHEN